MNYPGRKEFPDQILSVGTFQQGEFRSVVQIKLYRAVLEYGGT